VGDYKIQSCNDSIIFIINFTNERVGSKSFNKSRLSNIKIENLISVIEQKPNGKNRQGARKMTDR